jgi:hypothetical protein
MLEEDVLQELEKFYINNPVNVWIPSLKSDVNFRPISVGEQKSLIELENAGGANNLNYLVEGPKILNSLIKSTCIDENKFIEFTTIDRPSILLQLKHNTKSSVMLRVDDEMVDVNLTPFVNNLRTKKPGSMKWADTFSVDNFFVELRVPPLHIDEFYNGYFLSLYTDMGDVDMKIASGDAFFAEISKYISKITFETSKGPAVFQFTEFSKESFTRNLQLLEKLPAKVVSKISNYISKVKDYQIKLLTENIAVNGKKRNVFLDIDISFFTTL